MFAVLLALNLLFSAWWLSGNAFSTARASRLNQEVEAAATVVIPRTFSYQGTLRDANGNLVNGTVNLTLRLYKVVTGGAALHTESFANVPVRAGVFSVVVGDATPMAAMVFDNYPLYLGISVHQDPELLPRHRLHPVPYAMQATSAQTALTANNLVQGGGVPNLVSLGAGRAKKISFPDGGSTIDSATGMTISGGGANKLVTSGGDLVVSGNWNAGAILDHGDSNGGANVRSTYPVNINRYVVEAPEQGASPDTVPIDDALLTQLCQYADGCSVSLYMRDWDPANSSGLLSGIGPYRMALAAPANGKRQWSVHNESGVGTLGLDNDGAGTPVLNVQNARFLTDGEVVNGGGSDAKLGFGLLNWFGAFDSAAMTCVLIIED